MRRTPTAASRNSSRIRLFSLVAAGLVGLLAVPAWGQPPEAGNSETSPTDAAPESASHPTVLILVVGSRLAPSLLASTLGAETQNTFSLDFGTAAHFGPQDLFRARLDSSADIYVWVDTTTPGVVRLYFVNRAGTRYLVRTMELSDEIDEMDREALAQAIEWSLSALREGTAGMTREEAESLLQVSGVEPEPTTPPAPTTRAPRPRPSWRSRRGGWLPEVASFYRFASHSDEIPIMHGPGLRVGLDRVTPARQLGVAASAQYQFPQRHSDDRVALELRTLALRAELRTVETSLSRRAALVASLGAGLDTTRTTSEVRDPESFTVEPTRGSTVPLLAGGFGGQFRFAPTVRLELGIGLELDLVRVQFDLDTTGGVEHFVSRWPAHPTGTLAVEFW